MTRLHKAALPINESGRGTRKNAERRAFGSVESESILLDLFGKTEPH